MIPFSIGVGQGNHEIPADEAGVIKKFCSFFWRWFGGRGFVNEGGNNRRKTFKKNRRKLKVEIKKVFVTRFRRGIEGADVSEVVVSVGDTVAKDDTPC